MGKRANLDSKTKVPQIDWNLVQAYIAIKFPKLIEILYSGTLLYAYYSFSFNFFKIHVIHIFWANLVPKFGTWVHCYMFITILIFILSKFLSFYFFRLILSANLKFFKLESLQMLLCFYCFLPVGIRRPLDVQWTSIWSLASYRSPLDVQRTSDIH